MSNQRTYWSQNDSRVLQGHQLIYSECLVIKQRGLQLISAQSRLGDCDLRLDGSSKFSDLLITAETLFWYTCLCSNLRSSWYIGSKAKLEIVTKAPTLAHELRMVSESRIITQWFLASSNEFATLRAMKADEKRRIVISVEEWLESLHFAAARE